MSVLINMDMPNNCRDCPLEDVYEGYNCRIVEKSAKLGLEGRPPWCPLVYVPPHGDLIEESKVLDIVFEWCPDDDGSVGKDGDLREMLDEIEALPAIIPTDESNVSDHMA